MEEKIAVDKLSGIPVVGGGANLDTETLRTTGRMLVLMWVRIRTIPTSKQAEFILIKAQTAVICHRVDFWFLT